MQNPFRSEAEAFRFLIRTIAYFAVIAVAALINTWLGVAVFVAATGVIVWWLFFRGDPKRPIQTAPARHGGEDERRILVVANETVGGADTPRNADPPARPKAYARRCSSSLPALNSPIRHWVSDEDGARAAAEDAARESLSPLARGRRQRARRGRRLRAASGDRGRAPDVRRRRDHHLDASRGPLALAGRASSARRASASSCRSRTSWSTSTPSAKNPLAGLCDSRRRTSRAPSICSSVSWPSNAGMPPPPFGSAP